MKIRSQVIIHQSCESVSTVSGCKKSHHPPLSASLLSLSLSQGAFTFNSCDIMKDEPFQIVFDIIKNVTFWTILVFLISGFQFAVGLWGSVETRVRLLERPNLYYCYVKVTVSHRSVWRHAALICVRI